MLEKLFIIQWKAKLIIGFLLGILAVLVGKTNTMAFIAIFGLIVIDIFTGLWKAWVLRIIKSNVMAVGVIKGALFLILCVSVNLVALIHSSYGFISGFIYAGIGLTEIISILENVFIICSHYEICVPWLCLLLDRLYISKFMPKPKEDEKDDKPGGANVKPNSRN